MDAMFSCVNAYGRVKQTSEVDEGHSPPHLPKKEKRKK